MPKLITMTDDDTGVTTTVVVADKGGAAQVQEIRISTTNAAGLQPGDLDVSTLQMLGLAFERAQTTQPEQPEQPALPTATAEPATATRSATQPATSRRRGKAKPPGRAGKVDKLGRGYRRAPEVKDLQRLFTEHGGTSGVARALGVPPHSVTGWLRRYRNEGHVFELAI
jgi:hypothetical protein